MKFSTALELLSVAMWFYCFHVSWNYNVRDVAMSSGVGYIAEMYRFISTYEI